VKSGIENYLSVIQELDLALSLHSHPPIFVYFGPNVGGYPRVPH